MEKNITDTCKDDLRAVMRSVIGESSDTAEVTCDEEINVFAPDTSHYVVCGFRYDPAKKDYYISAYRGYPYEDDKSVIREISVKDMDTEDVKALLESGALSKAERQSAAPKETPATVFEEYKGYGYSARTYENARKADLTLAFAVDFTTAGENGIYTLARNGWTQERADAVVTDVLTALQNHGNIHIDSVRSGGQTGIDEAGIKAGVALGLPTTVLAPKGWAFRTANRQDIFSEVAFKARFSRTPKTRQTASPAPEKNWTPVRRKEDGKWNYRDAAGHVLLNTWVDKAFPFEKGLATVINKGNNIQINDKGIVTAIQKINKGIKF